MKKYQFMLDTFQVDTLIKPIRSKVDIISIWMNLIKIALVNVEPEEELVAGRVVLIVDKMSRLFVSSENHLFSINFPFVTLFEEDCYSFKTYSQFEVDHKFSSDVLFLISSENALMHNDFYKFIDPILDLCEFDSSVWCVFRDLMLYEDGYLRYDHDLTNENGNMHPLNHLDVYYSQSATFKIGLEDKIDHEGLFDILDIRTNCRFLNP